MRDSPVEFVVRTVTRNTANSSYQGAWWARVRLANQTKQAMFWALAKHVPRGTEFRLPILVTLTRISSGTLDKDGLATSLKYVQDSVAGWLGIDDGDTRRIGFRYLQAPGKRGRPAVRVLIEPATELYEETRKVVP